MIYLSNTDRDVTEKYMLMTKKGMPNSVILPYHEVLKKQDAKKVWLFGILRGCNLVYEHWPWRV